jgi:hypothetical protein
MRNYQMTQSSHKHRNHKHRTRKNRRSRITSGRKHGKSSSSSFSELGLAGSLVGASSITQGSELEPNQNQGPEDLMFIGGRGRGRGSGSGTSTGSGAGNVRKPGCVNDIADHILCFLELLNTIKIYHWSTLSYPTHKATDELHTKLSELVDSFIEIYIGHCARGKGGGDGLGVPVFKFKSEKDASIEFCVCKSLDAFCKVLDDNIVHLEGLTDKLNGYTDLVNIRDEMVGALAQALYLLRLK